MANHRFDHLSGRFVRLHLLHVFQRHGPGCISAFGRGVLGTAEVSLAMTESGIFDSIGLYPLAKNITD